MLSDPEFYQDLPPSTVSYTKRSGAGTNLWRGPRLTSEAFCAPNCSFFSDQICEFSLHLYPFGLGGDALDRKRLPPVRIARAQHYGPGSELRARQI
jgi:hypothetical protein